MLFHQNGYVSEDPRIEEARGHGIDRPEDCLLYTSTL